MTSSWQVQDAIGLMRSDYGHLQTIAVIAESVGLCPRQLERLFKAETGLTPIQYLRQLRLEQACQLLLNSPVSIKEIAVCVGLSSQSYFVREFKRAFHMTPSEFRQGYKNSRLSLKNQLMS
ncbi:MAG TPA: helix-turn-helix transcriptional regulator [Blastocatellia bacterium]|nr:helix-turn-helix transcriptional regulator [Blastocatellia bacterium]